MSLPTEYCTEMFRVELGPDTPDMVNHPPHYTSHPSGVECITITRHMNFNLGTAFGYIWRADLKGKSIEDLEKAVFHLKDEIEQRRHKVLDQLTKEAQEDGEYND